MRKIRAPRKAATTLFGALRLCSAAAAVRDSEEHLVSVRSKGYGPSQDLLKGVPPNSHVVLETNLHPEDVEVQRSVIALSMPGLTDVTVVDAGVPMLKRTGGTAPLVPPSSELDARMAMLEHTVEDQLATMANLIVDQVSERTQSQLATMEVSQSNEAQTLANLVVDCIREELRTMSFPSATSVLAPQGIPQEASSAPIDIHSLSERISQLVISSIEPRLLDKTLESPATPKAGGASPTLTEKHLEEKVNTFFELMRSSMKDALAQSGSEGSPTSSLDPSASAELRSSLVEAIEQSARVQQESIATVLEDMMQEHLSSRKEGHSQVDFSDLEAFIESSLKTAADDIRHSIAAEVKKAIPKGKKGAVQQDDSYGRADSVSGEEISAISQRLEDAVQKTQQLFDTFVSVDDAIRDVQKDQKQATELMMNVHALVEKFTTNAQTYQAKAALVDDAASIIPLATDGDTGSPAVLQALDALRASVANVSAAIDVGNDRVEAQLLSAAQAIGDTVQAAIASSTSDAVEQSIVSLRAQLEKVLAAQQPQQQQQQHRDDAPPLLVEKLSAEEVAAAVESVLTPRLDKLVNTYQQQREADMLTLANTISEAFQAHLKEQPVPITNAELDDKLNAIREDIVAAVEKEMGKTHEVNLTPMYKYIDSVLTFLKERSDGNTALIDQKASDLTISLSEVIRLGSSEQRDSLTELIKQQMQAQSQQSSDILGAIAALTPVTPPAQAEVTKGEETTKAALEEVTGMLKNFPTSADLRGITDEINTSVGATVKAAIASSLPTAAPPNIEAVPPVVDTAAIAAAVDTVAERRNEELLSTLKGMVAPQEREEVAQSLRDIQAALKRRDEVPPPRETPVAATTASHGAAVEPGMLKEIVENLGNKLEAAQAARKADVDSALGGISSDVRDHSDALRSLQNSALETEKALREAAYTTEEQRREWSEVRAQTKDKIDSIASTLEQIVEGEKNAASVLQQLRSDISDLHQISIEHKNWAQQQQQQQAAEPIPAPTSGEGEASQASAASAAPSIDIDALANTVRTEVAAFSESVREGMKDATSLQQSIRGEVLDALQGIVSSISKQPEPQPAGAPVVAPFPMDEFQSQLNQHIATIETLLQAQEKRLAEEGSGHSKHIVEAIERATRMSAESAVKEMTSAYSERVLEGIEEKMTKQSQVLSNIVQEGTNTLVKTSSSTPAVSVDSKAIVDALLQQLASEKDRLAALSQPRVEPVPQPPPSAAAAAAAAAGQTQAIVTRVYNKPPWWWLLVSPLAVVLAVLFCAYYLFACFLLAFVPAPSDESAASSPPQFVEQNDPTPNRGRRVADQVL